MDNSQIENTINEIRKRSGAVTAFNKDKISNAIVSKEFPARTAVDSPNLICVDGLPLLILSLSIQGKSSWINE